MSRRRVVLVAGLLVLAAGAIAFLALRPRATPNRRLETQAVAGAQPGQRGVTPLRVATSGESLLDSVAVGGPEGFWRVEQAEGGDARIVYTPYAGGEPAEGPLVEGPGPVRLAYGGGSLFVLQLGYYSWEPWDHERQAAAVWRLEEDVLAPVWEFADNQILHPDAVVVYDGEGIYLDLVHNNGAKGTIDLVMLYLYADGSERVDMKYYPIESMQDPHAPLLYGGVATHELILRRGGEYYGYHWGSGALAETPSAPPPYDGLPGETDAWGRRRAREGMTVYAASDTAYLLREANGGFYWMDMEDYWFLDERETA